MRTQQQAQQVSPARALAAGLVLAHWRQVVEDAQKVAPTTLYRCPVCRGSTPSPVCCDGCWSLAAGGAS